MRRIDRPPLSDTGRDFLRGRQRRADEAQARGDLDIGAEWSGARRARAFTETVLPVLRTMAGECERCMYCEDAEGCDVEHFRPKSVYPGHAFAWLNLLLCCATCGRLKGAKFPLDDAQLPLLIDPTAEDPWDYLSFEERTGHIAPRYDMLADRFTPKGEATVDVLHLDRREALANSLKRSYRRIERAVCAYLEQGQRPWPIDDLAQAIRLADDHGLIEWCFRRDGRNDPPFSTLREREPDTWTRLLDLLP